MKKSEVLNQINNSASSIFSKDDVIKLINSVSTPDVKPTNYESLEESILKAVRDGISSVNWRDIVNEDDVELDLCGREIEIDCSSAIDLDKVEQRVSDLIEEIFSDIRDSQEEEALETNSETENN